MAKYLVTYHGGSMPANPEQAAAMQAAFGEWLSKAGDAVVDPGAPIRPAAQLPKDKPAPHGEIGGYSVIEAPSLEAAVDVLKSHPFVARGGTLQVHEALAL